LIEFRKVHRIFAFTRDRPVPVARRIPALASRDRFSFAAFFSIAASQPRPRDLFR